MNTKPKTGTLFERIIRIPDMFLPTKNTNTFKIPDYGAF